MLKPPPDYRPASNASKQAFDRLETSSEAGKTLCAHFRLTKPELDCKLVAGWGVDKKVIYGGYGVMTESRTIQEQAQDIVRNGGSVLVQCLRDAAVCKESRRTREPCDCLCCQVRILCLKSAK